MCKWLVLLSKYVIGLFCNVWLIQTPFYYLSSNIPPTVYKAKEKIPVFLLTFLKNNGI